MSINKKANSNQKRNWPMFFKKSKNFALKANGKIVKLTQVKSASFQINSPVDCYLLPENGLEAKSRLLDILKLPHETWIIAYAFTMQEIADELIQAKKNKIAFHLYLDHSQAVGSVERSIVQQIADAGIDVTIGTSLAGQKYICHTKGIVIDTPTPTCIEGSTNFSQSAWSQVNTMMIFESQLWKERFVEQFNALVEYAWTKEQAFQVMKTKPEKAY